MVTDDCETKEDLNLGASVFQESGFAHTAGRRMVSPRLKHMPSVTKLALGQPYASFSALSFDFRLPLNYSRIDTVHQRHSLKVTKAPVSVKVTFCTTN